MLISRVYAIGGSSADPLPGIDNVIIKIFGYIWPFVGIVLMGMFINGGVMWLMSEGDPQRLAKAKATMLWAVVGAAVIILIGFIMNIFTGIFQVNIDLTNPQNIFNR